MGRLDGWRFCPRCAGTLARDGLPGRADCPACGYVAWANAAPTASALIEDAQGCLLLGRRAIEPFHGRWDIVGGFLEESEHPLDALVREVREETGLAAVPGDFLGCWMDTYGPPGEGVLHTLNLFWVVRVAAGAGGEAPVPVPADDVAELAWFAPGELPRREELAFTCVPLAIEAWRQRGAQGGGAAA